MYIYEEILFIIFPNPPVYITYLIFDYPLSVYTSLGSYRGVMWSLIHSLDATEMREKTLNKGNLILDRVSIT